MSSFASLVQTPLTQIGRRASARLRLSVPAKLLTIYDTLPCVLIDISQNGAQIAIERPLLPGDGVYLRCGDLEHFASVVRSGPGRNGLEFEIPITHDQVLDIRRLAEDYAFDDGELLRREARAWVTGGH